MENDDLLNNIEKNIQNDEDINSTEQGLFFNPYNPINKEITLNIVQSILSKYGISAKISNLSLYQRAFIHKSYTKRPFLENNELNINIAEKPINCLALSSKSNERLEFLGDGVLKCITKYYLYRRFPKADEGFMTEKKIALVKNEHIGKLAYEMQLHNYFIISKHAEEKKTRTNLKKLGCLFEAFLGALFLDFNKMTIKDENNWFADFFVCGPGSQMAQKFVENVFEEHVDWISLIKNDDNYKNILQVWIQKEFKNTPEYINIEYNEENGYKMGVYICLPNKIAFNGDPRHNESEPYDKYKSFSKIKEEFELKGKLLIHLGTGSHKIKKKAEQEACENSIKLITENN